MKYYHPLSYEFDVQMRRADTVAVSFLQQEYTGSSGVHGMYVWEGVNLDPLTGEKIPLSAVVKDKDALVKAICKQLRQDYPHSSFDGLEAKLQQEASSDTLNWTLDPRGITFYFNPYEIASYAEGLLMATILFREQPELFNIAADIVVNSNILYSMGIPEFEVAGIPAMHMTPDGREGYHFSAEEVYKMLLQNAVSCGIAGNAPDCSSDDSSGLSGSGGNDDDNGNMSVSGGESDSGTESSSGSFDSHEIWSSVEENDAETDKWKKLTVEGGRKYSSAEMPLSVREYILELEREAKVDWRTVLQDFIQLYHDRFDYSFFPSDRRYTWSDFVIPAFSEQDDEQIENLWFCVDTSGSISRDLLSEVLSEIRQAILLFDHLSGKLSFFDTHVTEPIPFDDEEDLLDIPAAGGGGTSFAAIFRYLKKFSEEDMPSAIIVLTDGYCDYPQESAAMDIPVLWIIYDNPVDPPWGRFVHIDSD